jgi:hypothetical protein
MGETAQEVTLGPVLSKDEKRVIVRGFVKGFLSGSVKVTIWEAPSYNLTTMKEPPGEVKAQLKSHTIKLIDIVSGTKPATDEQIEEAMNWLFEWIVTLRSGDFIDGEFVGPPDWESRLSELEKRVSSIEKLFEELLQRSKIQSSV